MWDGLAAVKKLMRGNVARLHIRHLEAILGSMRRVALSLAVGICDELPEVFANVRLGLEISLSVDCR